MGPEGHIMGKIRKARQIKLTCIGGPFDGHSVTFSEGVHYQTLPFSISSYNDGEKGRYVQSSTYANKVKWEKL